MKHPKKAEGLIGRNVVIITIKMRSTVRIFKVVITVVENQIEYFRLEQRRVTKFLLVEKCKPCETYRGMCDVYIEECFSQKCL